MKRRDFLRTSAAGTVAAGASALAAPAIAQEKRELKMVTTWPKNFPGLGTGAQRVADRITAASGGRINVKLFAAGELVPAFESFDAVSGGTADMYHGADYYWQGKSKGFPFFTTVPYGLTAPEISAWMHWGGGQELHDELSGQYGIKPLMAGNTGVQMGGWFNKEINSVEDLKGLKFRMPGLGGEVLRELGVSVVNLPGGEIFPSLQSGAIDGTEWVGPWNDLAFGFYKITKNYYWPGFHEPGPILHVGMNRKVWDSFNEADQALIKACCEVEHDIMLAEFNAKNGDALATLRNEHGVQLRKFNDNIMTQIGEAAGDVMASVANEGDLVKRIYESFVEFRQKAIAWSKFADQGYMTARGLPFEYK